KKRKRFDGGGKKLTYVDLDSRLFAWYRQKRTAPGSTTTPVSDIRKERVTLRQLQRRGRQLSEELNHPCPSSRWFGRFLRFCTVILTVSGEDQRVGPVLLFKGKGHISPDEQRQYANDVKVTLPNYTFDPATVDSPLLHIDESEDNDEEQQQIEIQAKLAEDQVKKLSQQTNKQLKLTHFWKK
ncbi:unnamed protein product, partial [Rotaria sordida]